MHSKSSWRHLPRRHPWIDWIAAAQSAGVPVFASRDWHPYEHASFENRGGPWPRHCVQGTEGAFFQDDLALPKEAEIISKGAKQNVDAYSAFGGTDLAKRLEELNIRRLFVGGVALDACVRATVLDALRAGIAVHLIRAGTRPVDEEAGREALAEMAYKLVEYDGEGRMKLSSEKETYARTELITWPSTFVNRRSTPLCVKVSCS